MRSEHVDVLAPHLPVSFPIATTLPLVVQLETAPQAIKALAGVTHYCT
jgi:hypothetical protein